MYVYFACLGVSPALLTHWKGPIRNPCQTKKMCVYTVPTDIESTYRKQIHIRVWRKKNTKNFAFFILPPFFDNISILNNSSVLRRSLNLAYPTYVEKNPYICSLFGSVSIPFILFFFMQQRENG